MSSCYFDFYLLLVAATLLRESSKNKEITPSQEEELNKVCGEGILFVTFECFGKAISRSSVLSCFNPLKLGNCICQHLCTKVVGL